MKLFPINGFTPMYYYDNTAGDTEAATYMDK